jgi:glycosyltransferase involved in cell wall biosynthesis
VVVPVRNERDNIEPTVQRIPEMEPETEIILVEGGSTDGTWKEVQRVLQVYSRRKIRAIQQRSVGKAGAVREGFAAADGDILLILDSDLTVSPEDLHKFYRLLVSGEAEFVNGVRLAYPMEDKAMRFLNKAANKLFARAISWLLGQSVRDTLCGTKGLWREDYELISTDRGWSGSSDPFGDFDLLLGAARLNLRITDVPVRYKARTYGQTKTQRWRNGLLLLRTLGIGAARLKLL